MHEPIKVLTGTLLIGEQYEGYEGEFRVEAVVTASIEDVREGCDGGCREAPESHTRQMRLNRLRAELKKLKETYEYELNEKQKTVVFLEKKLNDSKFEQDALRKEISELNSQLNAAECDIGHLRNAGGDWKGSPLANLLEAALSSQSAGVLAQIEPADVLLLIDRVPLTVDESESNPYKDVAEKLWIALDNINKLDESCGSDNALFKRKALLEAKKRIGPMKSYDGKVLRWCWENDNDS